MDNVAEQMTAAIANMNNEELECTLEEIQWHAQDLARDLVELSYSDKVFDELCIAEQWIEALAEELS